MPRDRGWEETRKTHQELWIRASLRILTLSRREGAGTERAAWGTPFRARGWGHVVGLPDLWVLSVRCPFSEKGWQGSLLEVLIDLRFNFVSWDFLINLQTGKNIIFSFSSVKRGQDLPISFPCEREWVVMFAGKEEIKGRNVNTRSSAGPERESLTIMSSCYNQVTRTPNQTFQLHHHCLLPPSPKCSQTFKRMGSNPKWNLHAI